MNYFNVYKSRMKSYGNNPEEVLTSATKQLINKSFNDSLSSTEILIDDVLTDVIINQGKTFEDKNILLRPDQSINCGAIAVIEGMSYLVISFNENNLYSTANAKLCNNTLKLKGEPTQTVIGYDHRGAPIYETVEGVSVEVPCIAENKVMVGDSNQPINLPDGRLMVTIPYTIHDNININKTFNMYDTEYLISNVDKTKSINGVGLIIITGQRKV